MFKGSITSVSLIQFILFISLVVVSDMLLWVISPVAGNHQRVESNLKQNIPGLKRSIKYESGLYGLRMLSDLDAVKSDNLVRILCIGASSTQQTTQETQDTWCGIIETELRKYYENTNIEVQTIAYGKGGLRAPGNAQWLMDNIDNIDPDMVITLLGINDLAWNGGENYTYSGFKKPVKTEKKPEGWCNRYSQICRRINRVLENQRVKAQIKTGEVVQWHSVHLPHQRKKYRDLPYVESPAREPDPVHEFHDAVRWIMGFLKQRNVQAVVLGQPVLWKENFTADEVNSLWFSVNTQDGPVRPSGAWLKDEMVKYNVVQAQLARQSGFIYLDLDKSIPKTLRYYFDDCHFTDIGSNAVATAVLPVVIEAIERSDFNPAGSKDTTSHLSRDIAAQENI